MSSSVVAHGHAELRRGGSILSFDDGMVGFATRPRSIDDR